MSKQLVAVLVVLNLAVLIVAVFLVGAMLGFGAQRNALDSVEAAIKERWSAKSPQFVQEQPVVSAGFVAQTEPQEGAMKQPMLIRQPTRMPTTDEPASLEPKGRDLVYIEALNRLSQDAEQRQSEAEEQLPESLDSNKEFHNTKTDRSMDRFNRIYVPENGRPETLVTRLEQLVGDPTISEKDTKTGKIDPTYVRSVNLLAGERQNQNRTIRVRRGDTLFKIARRAYGDGDQYPKIYKANPHLRNPNLIAIGDILRVPR